MTSSDFQGHSNVASLRKREFSYSCAAVERRRRICEMTAHVVAASPALSTNISYVIGQAIIFLPCGFYLLSFFLFSFFLA